MVEKSEAGAAPKTKILGTPLFGGMIELRLGITRRHYQRQQRHRYPRIMCFLLRGIPNTLLLYLLLFPNHTVNDN